MNKYSSRGKVILTETTIASQLFHHHHGIPDWIVLFYPDHYSTECRRSVSFKFSSRKEEILQNILFRTSEIDKEYDNIKPEPESILDDLIALDYVDKYDISEEGKLSI